MRLRGREVDVAKNQLTVMSVRRLDGTIVLNGSKFLSNRVFLLAASSEGTTCVENLLESDNIRCLHDAFDTLRVSVALDIGRSHGGDRGGTGQDHRCVR